ncbi:hypothetical protein J437_LFUL019037 [Ladona fulva]|uniref:Reverse transcriptase n=1 Tax=Ladona fulva TaxID=123851 RepID=A0A8K0JV57_LADFU|nr:hypothetical protein J437_LFUL019037 [Ladona fulva]
MMEATPIALPIPSAPNKGICTERHQQVHPSVEEFAPGKDQHRSPTECVARGQPTSKQMEWLITLGTMEGEDALEVLVREITTEATALTRSKLKTWERDRETNSSCLQFLYKINKGAAFRKVISSSSSRCDIPADPIISHFRRQPPSQTECPAPSVIPQMSFRKLPGENELLLRKISPTEVRSRLQRCKNTAPRSDGATYQDFRRLDPDGRVLAGIFKLCLQRGRVLKLWKSSRTVLIHKGGEAGDPSSWRPLALGAAMGKIFSGIIADRVLHWASKSGRLSLPSQKGFMPQTEGCFEHNFLLQAALDDARRNRREIAVA